MGKPSWGFDIGKVLTRALACLTEKDMEYVTDKKGNIKEKPLTREQLQERYENDEYPISVSAWDSYKKTISKTAETGTFSMKLESLYNICAYTDVSADYLLGFTGTKLKDQSAEMVREEFGLTDPALKRLQEMIRKPKLPLPKDYNFDEADYINFLIVNLARPLLHGIRDYFIALDESESYSDKNPGATFDEEIYLQKQALAEKYAITQILDKFLDKLWQEISYRGTL